MELKRIDLDVLFTEALNETADFSKCYFGSNQNKILTIYDGGNDEMKLNARYGLHYGTVSAVAVSPMREEFASFIADDGEDPERYTCIQYYLGTPHKTDLVHSFIIVETNTFNQIYQ